MTLTLHDDSISGDHTAHTGRLVPGYERAWEVSWLPGRRMDSNSAITAMVLADTVGAGGLRPGHRLWRHAEVWAADLGLTTPDALARISQPPASISTDKDSAEPADPEAGQ